MELVCNTAGQQSRPSLCDFKIHTPDLVAVPLGSPTHLGVLLLGDAVQPSLVTTEDASLGATGWPRGQGQGMTEAEGLPAATQSLPF